MIGLIERETHVDGPDTTNDAVKFPIGIAKKIIILMIIIVIIMATCKFLGFKDALFPNK